MTLIGLLIRSFKDPRLNFTSQEENKTITAIGRDVLESFFLPPVYAIDAISQKAILGLDGFPLQLLKITQDGWVTHKSRWAINVIMLYKITTANLICLPDLLAPRTIEEEKRAYFINLPK